MEEDLQKNINALEKEKQEYENGDVDVNETEFSLTEEEIDEWIDSLNKLKKEKGSVELEVDDENILKINFENGE